MLLLCTNDVLQAWWADAQMILRSQALEAQLERSHSLRLILKTKNAGLKEENGKLKEEVASAKSESSAL